MMQQVASAKSEVAAFAALQSSNEQTESTLVFEQVLKQQQTSAPVTKRGNSDGATEKPGTVQKSNEPTVSQTKIAQTASAPTEQNKSTDKNGKNTAELELKTSTKTENTNISKTEPEHGEQQTTLLVKNADTIKSAGAELNDNNDEQSLVKSTEQWIDLIWSLQDVVVADEQSNLIEIDNLDALKVWLEPMDDKQQALAELLEQQPEIQTWLTQAELSQSDVLNLLVHANVAQTREQKTAVATSSESMPEGLKQELLDLSLDVAELLQNKRLTATEILLVNQALAQSVEQNSPIDKELKSLLQEKMTSSLGLDVEFGKKAKLMLNDMPLIFVPQTDDAGKILEANTGKLALPAQALNEELQTLLNKITSLAKTSDELGADAKTKADAAALPVNSGLTAGVITNEDNASQLNKLISASVIENPQTIEQSKSLLNDKLSLSKEAALANSQVALKAENAAVSIANNDELKALLALSSDELDAALNSVAQRIAVLLRDESKNQIIVPNKLNSDVSVMATGKDVLAALKAGVAEFKDQLAAGHEPALDLKALVAQAIEKTADSGVVAKVVDGLDKSMRTLSQSLAAITQINESSISQALNTASVDSQVSQAEQHKAMQVNQFDNKLDKALNLHKPEGHQQLADKVRWMVNTGNLIAEIRLDPAELGSVHVKVSLSAESATVNFVVQSQQTRDALEAATPKLREMLAEKGIELGQSTVKQDNQTKQDSQGQAGQQAKNSSALETAEALSDEENRLVNQNNRNNPALGTIDYFV
jgi:flagellar hook-length control protein FliK